MLDQSTAVSLNYRDILVASRSRINPGIGGLPGNHKPDLVLCSDGAGIIYATGSESKWAGHEETRVLLQSNEWLSGDVRNLDLTKVFGAAGSDGTSPVHQLFI